MRLEPHLAPRPANHRPLTPLDFLDRALAVHPERRAVIWRGQEWSYAEFAGIVARLIAALAAKGVRRGDVVSVLLGNRPEMLAAHFAVPALGAVLNSINFRLDAGTIGYILNHAESRVLLTDAVHITAAREAVAETGTPLLQLVGPEGGEGIDLLSGPPKGLADLPDLAGEIADEWQPICLNYTSGTTGRPKGVVYHHRGAYLNALGNVMTLGFDRHTAYLWTLPMFHCNGWCHTWAVTAAGGTHVCLDRVDPGDIFRHIDDHGVTHMACAPVVLYMLINHPDRPPRDEAAPRVLVASGGAAPTVPLIAQLDALGFEFIHLYGLTESFGPATLCMPDEPLSTEQRAIRLARQGNRHITAGHVRIFDREGCEMPWDGESVGEITLTGNTLMAGYYRDPQATEAAFANGMLHTGDLAVRHPNGEIEMRDRAKDIIISGGENISSLEVENVLHKHPAVLLAAVVASPDPKWGEMPCAFIELKPGQSVDEDALRQFCRDHLAHFKVPARFVFNHLPRTATGKIQKFLLRDQAYALYGAPDLAPDPEPDPEPASAPEPETPAEPGEA